MDSQLITALIAGYFIGSIPFTQVVARSVGGIDLRKVANRNVGARNLSRQLGTGWAIVGGGLDVAKGAVSLWAAALLGVPYPALLLAGLASVAGHNWPIWLGFHGGKGLTPAIGCMLWVAPVETVISFIIGISVLKFTSNILLTTLSGFGSHFVLMAGFSKPPVTIQFVWALFLIILIASVPDIMDKFRTAGGVSAYMQDPDAVYKKPVRKIKPATGGKKGTTKIR
ncbi:MAG: glycerol-3-phosphate acyltransferase [Anaerolineales bacterium]